MQLNFEKPKPNRIFIHIVDQIQRAILSGKLKTGETLPSEMKLKEMFSASRGTVREALRVLEQKGLVDIKTGSGGGAVVKAFNTEKIAEHLDLLIETRQVSFDHLAEFREGVEGTVAAIAAVRATAEDIDKLKMLLAEAEQLLETERPDPQVFLHVDKQIHVALAEIVGNPLYLANLQIVHKKIVSAMDRTDHYDKQIMAKNYQDLCDLVKAVETHDAEKARYLAERHVRLFVERMKTVMERTGA